MKTFIKDWEFKAYNSIIVPIQKHPIEYFSKVFAMLGGYYTLCEAEQAVLDNSFLIEAFRNYFLIFLIIFIFAAALLHKKSLTHSEYLGTKDVRISLRIANILSQKNEAVVIPTNTTFDTSMDNDFISAKSIQGQFQRKYYGADLSALNAALKRYLEEYYPNRYKELKDRRKTNSRRYDIGTVAKVTLKDQHFYFLAVADVSKNGKPENVTMQNITKALVNFWDFLVKEGHTEPIMIPVIGTGRAGLKDGTFENVVHETIFSFAAKSQDEFVAKNMTICIYPSSLRQANVTWEKLCNYMDWQCTFFNDNQKVVNSANTVGIPIN